MAASQFADAGVYPLALGADCSSGPTALTELQAMATEWVHESSCKANSAWREAPRRWRWLRST